MTPDFFIAGAMKAGTTTLYDVLKTHPDICMSNVKEPVVVDRDDVWVHRNYFLHRQSQWLDRRWDRQDEFVEAEYKELFANAGAGQICGEGSPTYMASKESAKRIHQINPDARMIFMLRDPVNRAYSAYWHNVAQGGALYTFEKQIQFEPISVLYRGLYKEQIERYLACFPREQLHFCIFEQFVKNMQCEIDRICEFLNIKKTIDIARIPHATAKNIARTPRLYWAALLLNHFARATGEEMVSRAIDRRSRHGNLPGAIIKKLRDINLCNRPYRPMDPQTRKLLSEFYRRENSGLDRIIGVDLAQYWPNWA
ncbi:MAG: sulfotransferase [Planctomycetes bacterium]|nr:sulfotransferase [Planctomycetota bacterium]